MKQYLAIDIGGTAVKLGIVDETGAVGPKAEEIVNFDGYQTPVLTTVLKAAKAFVETQNIDVNTLEGVGVSATGQIDSRKGIVAGTCGNFPNYINSPIQAELERLFGLPVTVANDANCMTLGEVWVGGAKGYTDVIGVTLGTGVGGGILTGGRLLEGARGLGGELGHYRTHALDGVPCTCGATGCWERYAATTALVRAAQEKDPAWKDGRAIFAAAEAGNETVLALLDAWTDEIAQGLAGMVHIFNPQLILIGGGVSAQQKLLIEPIAAKVRASVMPAFAEGLEIRAAQLHNVIHAGQTRGKIESVILSALGQVMLTLSRLAQDLILFSMPEFGYFALPEAFTTGSSIMPQKRNPDVLELLRAKAAKVLGHAHTVAEMVRAAPSGYNRDLQEAKAPFFEGFDLTVSSLAVMRPLVAGLKVDKQALRRGFGPEVFATDRALELVAGGMPFRDAYREVKSRIGELAGGDPDAALAAKTHLGATGGLDLAALNARIREAAAWARREKRRHEACRKRLLGG